LLRLRLLLSDSEAGAFFLSFGVFTLLLLISVFVPSSQFREKNNDRNDVYR
jgi:hypothetical protein